MALAVVLAAAEPSGGELALAAALAAAVALEAREQDLDSLGQLDLP